ncbi:MAG: hypothetical protein Q8P80_00820, partial [Candidatus Levybacteria bacterium]|nr:hypothetical protein [Candidatus Levybacteria bacterium]
MSDIASIEVVTREGTKQPIKPLAEWVNAQLDQFSKGKPNEQAAEKIRSTCQFMRESASYFSELLRDENIQPEQLSSFYSTYEGALKARVNNLSGSEFIFDFSQNCRPLAEALQPDKLKELNSAELIALCRVLQMGANSKTDSQKNLGVAYLLATTIQDKVAIKKDRSEEGVLSTRKKEAETKIDQEHVIYAPKVSVIPDTHGLSPDYYGVSSTSENVVSIGDIIDAPKNLKRENFDRDKQKDQIRGLQKIKGGRYEKFSDTDIESELDRLQSKVERNNEAAGSVDIRRNVEVWSDLLENNRGKVVLGNHELMAMSGLNGNDSDLSQWLLDNNKGKTTLEVFGIDTSKIPLIAFNEDSGEMTPL